MKNRFEIRFAKLAFHAKTNDFTINKSYLDTMYDVIFL